PLGLDDSTHPTFFLPRRPRWADTSGRGQPDFAQQTVPAIELWDVAEISVSDQFGHDADGDLRHGLRADVETERSVYARQRLARDPFAEQVLKDHLDLAVAADQTDISRRRFGQVVQRLLVMLVAA